MSYNFYIVRTAFHGGGIVSKHYDLLSALNSQVKYCGTGVCRCSGNRYGCAVVVPVNEFALDEIRKYYKDSTMYNHVGFAIFTKYDDLEFLGQTYDQNSSQIVKEDPDFE